MAYITEGDLENFMIQDIDSTYSTWIASVIDAVEAYIDQYCGTDFSNSTSGDRYFDGSDSEELSIGPVQSISAVYILDISGNVVATLATADWHLYPLNSNSPSILKLASGGSWGSFPGYGRAVKITGIWGYSTAPLPVKMAGIQLAAKIINEGLRGGQVSSETLGSYSITYRKVDEATESMGIKEILDQYRVMGLD